MARTLWQLELICLEKHVGPCKKLGGGSRWLQGRLLTLMATSVL